MATEEGDLLLKEEAGKRNEEGVRSEGKRAEGVMEQWRGEGGQSKQGMRASPTQSPPPTLPLEQPAMEASGNLVLAMVVSVLWSFPPAVCSLLSMSPHTPPFFLARVLAGPESFCFHEESDMSQADDTVTLMTTPCHLPSACLPVPHSLRSQVCPRQGKVSVAAHDNLGLW